VEKGITYGRQGACQLLQGGREACAIRVPNRALVAGSSNSSSSRGGSGGQRQAVTGGKTGSKSSSGVKAASGNSLDHECHVLPQIIAESADSRQRTNTDSCASAHAGGTAAN
jgi:hypothetical protein